MVAGICASGTTPYVLGALRFASKIGAATIAITVNRNTPVARLADMLIATDVGPEILTGSTRLKSGSCAENGSQHADYSSDDAPWTRL